MKETTASIARRRRRRLAGVAVVLVLLTAALIWAAAAGSPSPSASTGKLILREGTTHDLDNAYPFVPGFSATAAEDFGRGPKAGLCNSNSKLPS